MKQQAVYKVSEAFEPTVLKESSDLSQGIEGVGNGRVMVRTQIYLTAEEHAFLLSEAQRTGGTMAGILRAFIDEKMHIPESAWEQNSLLEEAPPDVAWDGPVDLSRNLDHYLYGLPKIELSQSLAQKS